MTKGEIDRLGERIRASSEVTVSDLESLQAYRQSFQEPISRVFNSVLQAARRIDRRCIVTYRIKRLDTIIDKVKRFSSNANGPMQLSRMWDIAGCRCIMDISDEAKIYQLRDIILNEFGSGCKVQDHIIHPKESGYRSLHIYVKDKLDNKPVEIQIRNKAQHNWATLVEIVDLIYGTNNKETGATDKLGRFLSLYSRANELSEAEFMEMMRSERNKKVFEKMSQVLTRNNLNIRKQWLRQNQKGSFFVITANKHRSEIESFPTFSQAEDNYFEKYLENRDSNIVLTHLKHPSFEEISMAYSNYVLAMHAFFDDYRVLVSNKILECVSKDRYYQFLKCFSIYNDNVKYHLANMSMEAQGLQDCLNDSSIRRSQVTKWTREIRDRLIMWYRETRTFIQKLARTSRTKGPVYRLLIKNRVKSFSRVVNKGYSTL